MESDEGSLPPAAISARRTRAANKSAHPGLVTMTNTDGKKRRTPAEVAAEKKITAKKSVDDECQKESERSRIKQLEDEMDQDSVSLFVMMCTRSRSDRILG